MTWGMVAVGGMSLVSGVMASRSAKKQNQASNAMQGQSIAVQRDQLNLARQQDIKRNQIVDEMNTSRRRRSASADSIFDALVRNTQSMSPMEGVAGAVSTLEGTAGVARRSLRSDVGGGLSRQKDRALALTSRGQRAKLVNQITSANVARQNQMLASLANPVDLAVPGALTSGSAAGNLAAGFGDASRLRAAQASQSSAAAGRAFSTGANLLGGAWNDRQMRNSQNFDVHQQAGINSQLSSLFGED
jgi:hypothetical protein